MIEFTYTGEITSWTVPNGVTQITATVIGGGGGGGGEDFKGGNGCTTVATFEVFSEEILTISVGGGGKVGQEINTSGGGGSSQIFNNLTPLIISGGGGGGANQSGGQGGSGGSGGAEINGGGGSGSDTSGDPYGGGQGGSGGIGGAGGISYVHDPIHNGQTGGSGNGGNGGEGSHTLDSDSGGSGGYGGSGIGIGGNASILFNIYSSGGGGGGYGGGGGGAGLEAGGGAGGSYVIDGSYNVSYNSSIPFEYSSYGFGGQKNTNGGDGYIVLTYTIVPPDICLLKNTPILINIGVYKNIQDLQAGDFIYTPISNTQHIIKRVVKNTHNYHHLNPFNVPYKIPKHFFTSQIGEKTPIQDIYISGFHALLFNNNGNIKFIDVNQIQEFYPVSVDDLKKLEYINNNNQIEYFNIELIEIDGMFAGGVPIETIGLKHC